MKYIENWDEIKQRMTAYWNREPMDRCCVTMRVTKPGRVYPRVLHYYYDAESADRLYREIFDCVNYYGEAAPMYFPYFGTGGIAEYAGALVTRTPGTTWFDPSLTGDEPDAGKITFCHPEVFRAQKETVEKLVKLSGGDYAIAMLDNCGMADALAAIRGTEQLLLDMVTEPEFVEEGMRRMTEIYKQTTRQILDVTRENNEGSIISWMSLWSAEDIAQLQCDLSVMISPQMFERFIMPEMVEMCDYIPCPVYHFDGEEQVRHLDMLLSLDKLRAIQWQPVAGKQRTSNFIPELQKMQRAGKNLILSPELDEVVPLLDNLSSRGLQLNLGGIYTDEDARDMMKLIEKHSKDRKV